MAHALDIKPHASFTAAPFSFRREKKPGIPRNLRDFNDEVAFIMYTFASQQDKNVKISLAVSFSVPIVCKIYANNQ